MTFIDILGFKNLHSKCFKELLRVCSNKMRQESKKEEDTGFRKCDLCRPRNVLLRPPSENDLLPN